MFFRILKRDLKRKKTMNIILLLFVIMCSMFASASVNNILAVSNGIDGYFEISGVPDIIVTMMYDSEAEEKISALPYVRDVKTEHFLTVLDIGSFSVDGRKFECYTNIVLLLNDNERAIKFFSEDDRELPKVEKGTFYATSGYFISENGVKKGDKVRIRSGDTDKILKYAGMFKTATTGSSSADSPYILLNSEDFAEFKEDPAFRRWAQKQLFLNTDDPDAVQSFAEGMQNVYVGTREDYKTLYFYDMFVAYAMMIISILLMIAGMVILRFTIGFTVSEEIREIGVMKAIGISSVSIRMLYIVKYLGISVIGAVTGFFCSIPLSRMMLKNTSKFIVFGSSNKVMMGVISSCLIIALIMLFCYLCTRKVNKLSPIDAVRNGQTGERFGRKSLMHLGRSRLPASCFLPLNDIVSSPKQYSIITGIFVICLLLMTCISNFIKSLSSEKMIPFFGIPASHVTYLDIPKFVSVLDDEKECLDYIKEIKDRLVDEGIPCQTSLTVGARYDIIHNDQKTHAICLLTRGIDMSLLKCDEGYSPRKSDEIALTRTVLETINARIGDTVTLMMHGNEYRLMITGTFSSYIGGGYAAMLNDSFHFDMDDINVIDGVQITFDGDPDPETVDRNIEKMKQLFGAENIYRNSELIERLTGLSEPLHSMKDIIMILTVIITALVVILMERSFISKEKGEIALMKAVGLKKMSIVSHHVMRFVILSVGASLLTSLLMHPISYLLFNWVSSMMGDVTNVSPEVDKLNAYLICPAILIGVTAVSSFFTALYTRTIKASDTASIE